MTLEHRDRYWWSCVAATAAVVLLAEVGNGCRKQQSQLRSGEALYAAEAGLEFGKDELARVCGSPEALETLRRSAGTSFVALPGHEKPLSQIYGHDLPGGATAAVTLRVSEASPNAFVLRSLGHNRGVDKAVEATVTCKQIQARERPS